MPYEAMPDQKAEHPPQQFQRSQIREETERRLNKRALEILDIHSNN
jgi:hypothetical protein